MENRNQLLDASIERVMMDIEQTRREDIVVDANRVRLIPAPNGTRIEAAFEGKVHPVKQVALIPEIEKKPVLQKKQYTQADLKFAPATAITDKSITCCLCGKQALTLTARHLAHHEISVEDYKKLCGYEPTQKLMAREYLAKMTDNARRAQEARAAKRMEKEGQEG